MNFEWTPLGKKWTTVNLSNSSLLPFWRNRKHKESNNGSGGVCWCLPFPSIWSLLDQSPYCVNSDSHGGECGFYQPRTSCFRVMFKFCILVLRFLDIVNVEYISFKQIKNIRSRNGKSLLCKKKRKRKSCRRQIETISLSLPSSQFYNFAFTAHIVLSRIASTALFSNCFNFLVSIWKMLFSS